MFAADEVRPTDGIYEIQTNELDLGVVRQSGPNEMDVTVDSVEMPAVVDSSVVTGGEFGSCTMKQVVDETDILSAAGKDVLPVCADSPDELETGQGQAELFGSLYFMDPSVSHIGPVAHADVRAAEPVPMGVAV